MRYQEIETIDPVEVPVQRPIIEVLNQDVHMVLHLPQEVVEHIEEVQLRVEVQLYPVHREEALEATNLLDELRQEVAIIEGLQVQEVPEAIEVVLAEEVIEALVAAEVVAEAIAEVRVEAEARERYGLLQEAAVEVLEQYAHHQEVAEDNNISHCFI